METNDPDSFGGYSAGAARAAAAMSLTDGDMTAVRFETRPDGWGHVPEPPDSARAVHRFKYWIGKRLVQLGQWFLVWWR